jgi:hypothetical protein
MAPYLSILTLDAPYRPLSSLEVCFPQEYPRPAPDSKARTPRPVALIVFFFLGRAFLPRRRARKEAVLHDRGESVPVTLGKGRDKL